MPEWTLFFSPLSRNDLEDIYEYIALEIENVSVAQETVTVILD